MESIGKADTPPSVPVSRGNASDGRGPQVGSVRVAVFSRVSQFSILHVPFGEAFILLRQVVKSILVLVLILAAELVIRFKRHGVTVLSVALAGLERAGDWRI